MRTRVALAVMLVASSFFLNGAWEIYKKADIARIQHQKAKADLAELESRKETLMAGISKLRTDRGVEEVLREKYGVVKEGEEVVVLVDAPVHGEDPKTNQDHGFWHAVASFFGFE